MLFGVDDCYRLFYCYYRNRVEISAFAFLVYILYSSEIRFESTPISIKPLNPM